jgi:SNF2 family DNA or RNA helicase
VRLRDYQVEARGHLLRNPRAGLFMDMGLGKTATTLCTLTPEHLPALVIAPKRVAENVWDDEQRQWRPDLRLAVAKGTPEQRKRAAATLPDILVLGRDNIGDLRSLAPFRTLVLDELSSYKSPSSARFKHLRRLLRVNPVPNRWGLTGTPSPNGLLDLWSQMFLLDDGERLGRTLTAYRDRYFIAGKRLPSGIITEWILRPEAEAAIHRKIDDICLAMETEGRVDLPETIINHVEVPLPPAVRQAYRDMKDNLVANLELFGGDLVSAGTAATMSNRLSQMSAGFSYSDDGDGSYTVLHREKVNALKEIVEGTGSPVLVFYRYTAERDMIKEALGSLVHTVDEPDLQRRWNAGEFPVLLAHPASIGHGLNLQKGPGHTIVWHSLTWSLEEWLQSNKRLARSGQAHPVVIHILQAPRTVDGAQFKRLGEKMTVEEALLEHLRSPL